MLRFELSDFDEQKLNDWLLSIRAEIIEAQLLEMRKNGLKIYPFHRNEPYYGACGGGITYSFTPTGMGIVKTVIESRTGKKLDLTNYQDF
jgi:hypothetical protein